MNSRGRRTVQRAEVRQRRNASRRQWLNMERARQGLPPLAEKQSKIKNEG